MFELFLNTLRKMGVDTYKENLRPSEFCLECARVIRWAFQVFARKKAIKNPRRSHGRRCETFNCRLAQAVVLRVCNRKVWVRFLLPAFFPNFFHFNFLIAIDCYIYVN